MIHNTYTRMPIKTFLGNHKQIYRARKATAPAIRPTRLPAWWMVSALEPEPVVAAVVARDEVEARAVVEVMVVAPVVSEGVAERVPLRGVVELLFTPAEGVLLGVTVELPLALAMGVTLALPEGPTAALEMANGMESINSCNMLA